MRTNAAWQVEEKVDFAGQQVKIAKEVEVGSKEHEAAQVGAKWVLQMWQGVRACTIMCLYVAEVRLSMSHI
jgi:hypothetical protein